MRAIPDDNLAYPVLVTISDGSTGSGFYLNSDIGIFLVTARHVLFNKDTNELLSSEATLLSYSKDPNAKDCNLVRLETATLVSAGDVRNHPASDVTVVRIATITPEDKRTLVVPGVTVLSLAEAGILGVGIATIKPLDQVLVGNDVLIFGYPTSLGLKNIPQIDYQRPLLRKGIIAGRNDSLKTIILDCPVYPGNSGGPVLEVEDEGFTHKFRIIGVISQFVPVAETWLNTTLGYSNLSISNSGYSVAVPMDFVLELITGFLVPSVAAELQH